MIIMRISSGMGNQMFMYAAGLSLAKRLNTELKLDLQGFTSESFRKYALGIFPNITESHALLREIYALSPSMAIADYFHVRGNSIFKHPFRRLLYEFMHITGFIDTHRTANRPKKPSSVLTRIPFSRVYAQPDGYCIEEFKQIPDNTYIVGNWESEGYFAGCEDLIRRKFKFPPECFNPELTEQVRGCNSVAVHVRRTDKAMSDDYQSFTMRYLNLAIEKISSMTSSPKFFVFSDDIQWCRGNINKAHEAEYTFIEGQTPAQDMALITQCKHVIMGPSTFSWWGAWLNDNPDKIIISPADERKEFLPESWIKIS